MASSYTKLSPIIDILVPFLLLVSITLYSFTSTAATTTNTTTKSAEEFYKFSRIRAHLKKLNKPYLKTIQAHIYLFWLQLVAVIAGF